MPERQSTVSKYMNSYKTDLDAKINNYLNIYRDSFDIEGATSWHKYIYQMVDELLRYGLQESDKLHIKQKYGTFRCSLTTDNEEKQGGFIKIITAYTNKINSICERCENLGKAISIEGWEYRLCIDHFIELSDSKIDPEEGYQLSSFQQHDTKEYRNILTNKYHTINDTYALRDISIVHHYMSKMKVDKSIIREVLLESFIGGMGGMETFEIDEVFYRKKSLFIDENGNQIFPTDHYYSNEDFLLFHINRLCY